MIGIPVAAALVALASSAPPRDSCPRAITAEFAVDAEPRVRGSTWAEAFARLPDITRGVAHIAIIAREDLPDEELRRELGGRRGAPRIVSPVGMPDDVRRSAVRTTRWIEEHYPRSLTIFVLPGDEAKLTLQLWRIPGPREAPTRCRIEIERTDAAQGAATPLRLPDVSPERPTREERPASRPATPALRPRPSRPDSPTGQALLLEGSVFGDWFAAPRRGFALGYVPMPGASLALEYQYQEARAGFSVGVLTRFAFLWGAGGRVNFSIRTRDAIVNYVVGLDLIHGRRIFGAGPRTTEVALSIILFPGITSRLRADRVVESGVFFGVFSWFDADASHTVTGPRIGYTLRFSQFGGER